MHGSQLISLLTYAVVLLAAIIIGNWFLNEARKGKLKGDPWYKPYISIPGLIILAALSLPILIWLFSR
jgi:hypothetical protein